VLPRDTRSILAQLGTPWSGNRTNVA
jgi:hypothetical protein